MNDKNRTETSFVFAAGASFFFFCFFFLLLFGSFNSSSNCKCWSWKVKLKPNRNRFRVLDLTSHVEKRNRNQFLGELGFCAFLVIFIPKLGPKLILKRRPIIAFLKIEKPKPDPKPIRNRLLWFNHCVSGTRNSNWQKPPLIFDLIEIGFFFNVNFV